MNENEDLPSVVPSGSAHRVHGRRTVSYPSVTVDILSTRKIELHEWDLRRFTDPYWRLYWPLSPGGRVEINGQSTPLTPGYLYLIPPNTIFSTTIAPTLLQVVGALQTGALSRPRRPRHLPLQRQRGDEDHRLSARC